MTPARSYEDDKPPRPLLDDGRSVRQLHRRRRLGIPDHLTASQPLCARDAVDRVARAFCVLGSVCLRHPLGSLSRSPEDTKSRRRRRPLWKWSFAALNLGLVGMTGALLLSGFVQAFVERAIGGSTLEAFISGQENAWFVDGMVARFLLAIVFTAGYVVLVWDVLTLGRRAPAVAAVSPAQ